MNCRFYFIYKMFVNSSEACTGIFYILSHSEDFPCWYWGVGGERQA
uniref:Uncharacterized protein n=1 Tax=Anguilla anguilla TaxID=7936 RepID=A0A0E9R856_ANGAN